MSVIVFLKPDGSTATATCIGSASEDLANSMIVNGAVPSDWVFHSSNAKDYVEKISPEELRTRIKAEARRRILEILPEDKQRNLTARAAELAMLTNSRALSDEEKTEWDAGALLWNKIKAIRTRSNELEERLEVDYLNDSEWP
jgi:DNA-binding response OmpR family regulator